MKNVLLALCLTVASFEAKEPYLETHAFSQIADAAMPATVFIQAEVLNYREDRANPFDLFGDDFFQHFFGPMQPMQPREPQPQKTGGSGFLITADGYIVTNHHVIQNATKITVVLHDSTEHTATVKGSDPRTDLAVLKIEKENLPSLSFGDSDQLQVGEWVAAIGNPFGIGVTLTKGIVSAKGRQDLGIASYEDFIQTDAAINPGNSGGPLLDLEGNVIGVNTAIFTRSGGYMGIGLAIPSNMTEQIINQIIQTGSITRAYLGVVLQPLNPELAEGLGLDSQEGILISDVIKGSPADQASLIQGDILLECNHKPIKILSQFRNEIALMKPGVKVKLKILRNRKPKMISVTLGSQENEPLTTQSFDPWGFELENLTPELSSRLGLSSDVSGALITKVHPNSPAARAGLRSGFLITGMIPRSKEQLTIRNTQELSKAIQELGKNKHLILLVRHQNTQRYYTLKAN